MNIEAFRKKMQEDPAFSELVKALTSFEEIVALAKEQGFDFSLEELQSAELSDEELEMVVGGKKGGGVNPVPTLPRPERLGTAADKKIFIIQE